jgi:hypothetical protein
LEVKINYLTIAPEMFYLPREFRLNNKLSDQTKENLKNSVKTPYEKFKVNLKQLPDNEQENIIKTLTSKIDNLLEEEKRESVIFALLYLKYLSVYNIYPINDI